MLVLSRKKDQKIFITDSSGEVTVLTLVDVRGDKARLGFEAPASVVIDREEVYNKKRQEATGSETCEEAKT